MTGDCTLKKLYSQKKCSLHLNHAEKSIIETQYQQLREAHETLEKAHNALVLQQSPLAIAHDQLQQNHEKLSQQVQQQAQQLEAKQHTIIELQITLKTDMQKINELEDALKKANDKIESLRHEFQFISQEKANLEGQFKQLQTMLPGRMS